MCRVVCLAVCLFFLAAGPVFAQKVMVEAFKTELLFQAPEIEHPSVVACDEAGNLYVGEDPMDMRGPTTKHFDRIILIRWDKDGKPIRTVFAEGLAAVFGIVPIDGAVYVMHAPLFSVFRDTNGDGVADERKDLASGFGPPAGVYGFNDHIVTGTRLGLDGRIYVSVGDKGVPKATGADGSTISLEGGGVIRMRPDGTELEVVSSGTRNHLDVAMDSLDNIFTYDNTDDGLGWWTRFTHHIETGYYGYPYDYHPHADRHLPRISEHGGGSPVGAACYRDTVWPKQFWNAAFHCEWGKKKIQVFETKPKGATFTAEMSDFMVQQGPEEFRPQDLCFSPDGKHMYVADWNYGGWTNPKVCGRLFRVTYTGSPTQPPADKHVDKTASTKDLLNALAHRDFSQREIAQWELVRRAKDGKWEDDVLLGLNETIRKNDEPPAAKIHAIWTLNGIADRFKELDPLELFQIALVAQDPHDGGSHGYYDMKNVRAQAARAIGMRRLKGGVAALEKALKDKQAPVRMQAAIALGRIGDPAAAKALYEAIGEEDTFARFAIIQALRKLDNWEFAPQALASSQPAVRTAALLALTGEYDINAVKALVASSELVKDPKDRAAIIAALAEVHRKADPYTSGWWGTQPARAKPSRPKKHEWEGTGLVLQTLRAALNDRAPEVQSASIAALTELKDPAVVPVVVALVLDAKAGLPARQQALTTLVAVQGKDAGETIAKVAADAAAPPEIVAQALGVLADLKAPASLAAVEGRLKSEVPAVRRKALEAYTVLKGNAAAPILIEALKEPNIDLRKSAIIVAGTAGVRDAIPALLEVAADPAVAFEATEALCLMPDARGLGLYLNGLESKNQTVRNNCRQALIAIKGAIGKAIVARQQANELSPAMRRELQGVFAAPSIIRAWQIVGAWPSDKAAVAKLDLKAAPDTAKPLEIGDKKVSWKAVQADNEGQVKPDQHVSPKEGAWSVGYANIPSDSDQDVEFLLGSDDMAVLYVNGEQVYEFRSNRGFKLDQDRGRMKLRKGDNHIYFLCGNATGPWGFGLAARMKDPQYAFLYENVPAQLDVAAYRDFATKTAGDPARGRTLFADMKGVGCIKCHAVAGEGAKIGPDLVGVGARYAREELIRSILEPSARVAAGYQVTTIATDDGRVLAGIVKSEDENEVEIIDAQTKSFKVAKKSIEDRTAGALSLMPNGLKDGLSLADFADIVAYLESLKQMK